MNIKAKIKFYMHKGLTETDAVILAIRDAQEVINDIDKKLAKAVSFLTKEQVKEVYGEFER